MKKQLRVLTAALIVGLFALAFITISEAHNPGNLTFNDNFQDNLGTWLLNHESDSGHCYLYRGGQPEHAQVGTGIATFTSPLNDPSIYTLGKCGGLFDELHFPNSTITVELELIDSTFCVEYGVQWNACFTKSKDNEGIIAQLAGDFDDIPPFIIQDADAKGLLQISLKDGKKWSQTRVRWRGSDNGPFVNIMKARSPSQPSNLVREVTIVALGDSGDTSLDVDVVLRGLTVEAHAKGGK